MAVIIEPPGHRVALEYHELPDVGGIRCLVIPHEDIVAGLSHHLYLAGCMRHDEPGTFCKTTARLPGFLENFVGLLDRDLEKLITSCRPALEDIVRRYAGKRELAKERG